MQLTEKDIYGIWNVVRGKAGLQVWCQIQDAVDGQIQSEVWMRIYDPVKIFPSKIRNQIEEHQIYNFK
jgi:hypothetical protein